MSENLEYEPPKVWIWDKDNGGTWASTNRPISGATHEQVLPRGEHKLQLYSMGTPNGQKVSIMLEELLALGKQDAEYDAFLIDIGKGDQFASGFVEINPNSKIPALVDYSVAGEGQRIFESGSILLYLAEKFDAFLPTASRTEVLNWLFWQMGSAPYVGGGFGHFYAYAPKKFEYAIDRFTMETKRQLHVLELQCQRSEFIAGAEYTIADIAIWPWYGSIVLGTSSYNADEFLSINEYPNLQRWAKTIADRIGVKRGKYVNKTWGDLPLPERHSAADIDALFEN